MPIVCSESATKGVFVGESSDNEKMSIFGLCPVYNNVNCHYPCAYGTDAITSPAASSLPSLLRVKDVKALGPSRIPPFLRVSPCSEDGDPKACPSSYTECAARLRDSGVLGSAGAMPSDDDFFDGARLG